VSATSKKKQTTVKDSGIILARIKLINEWIHENQNWFYIAIIGFCLSVTILYKLFQ